MKFKVITFGILLSLSTLSQALSNCNYFQNLEPGKSYYVYNHKYPESYQGQNQCMWQMTSPYKIKINCTLNISPSPNCTKDNFSVQFDGKKIDRYCGYGTFEGKGKNAVIKFNSQFDTKGGRFLCELRTEEFDEYNCQCGWKNPTYIVGGKETGVNEYPMMAGIIDSQMRELYCGATIISEWHVLTAAHCVENRDPNIIGVIVGEHDINTGKDTSATKVYRINKCTLHPNYRDVYNDIAVCQIIGKIEYNVKVGPACLPFEHRQDSFIGSYVKLLGWGLLEFGGAKSNVLQEVDVSVISTQTCAKYYYPGKQITYNQMCTYSPGKDSCQMDSGGPALWENPSSQKMVLVGVTSGGIGCDSGTPAIYTRVGSYIDWIQFVTPGVQYCKME